MGSTVVLGHLGMIDPDVGGPLLEVVHRVGPAAHHLGHQPVGVPGGPGRVVHGPALGRPPCLQVAVPGGQLEGHDGELSAPLQAGREVSFGAALITGSGHGALYSGPNCCSRWVRRRCPKNTATNTTMTTTTRIVISRPVSMAAPCRPGGARHDGGLVCALYPWATSSNVGDWQRHQRRRFAAPFCRPRGRRAMGVHHQREVPDVRVPRRRSRPRGRRIRCRRGPVPGRRAGAGWRPGTAWAARLPAPGAAARRQSSAAGITDAAATHWGVEWIRHGGAVQDVDVVARGGGRVGRAGTLTVGPTRRIPSAGGTDLRVLWSRESV